MTQKWKNSKINSQGFSHQLDPTIEIFDWRQISNIWLNKYKWELSGTEFLWHKWWVPRNDLLFASIINYPNQCNRLASWHNSNWNSVYCIKHENISLELYLLVKRWSASYLDGSMGIKNTQNQCCLDPPLFFFR